MRTTKRNDLVTELKIVADKHFGGHVTIMKFTTNWRVGFGTPMYRCDIDQMWEGSTFTEAAEAALYAHKKDISPRCQTHELLWREGISGVCPHCGDVLPSATAHTA